LAGTALASGASVGDSYDFANLTPSNGASIAYSDWYNAGSYIRFTIKPDSNHPCGSEYYWLEVNGRRLAQFAAHGFDPRSGQDAWKVGFRAASGSGSHFSGCIAYVRRGGSSLGAKCRGWRH
jgi:hypothetical protein